MESSSRPNLDHLKHCDKNPNPIPTLNMDPSHLILPPPLSLRRLRVAPSPQTDNSERTKARYDPPFCLFFALNARENPFLPADGGHGWSCVAPAMETTIWLPPHMPLLLAHWDHSAVHAPSNHILASWYMVVPTPSQTGLGAPSRDSRESPPPAIAWGSEESEPLAQQVEYPRVRRGAPHGRVALSPRPSWAVSPPARQGTALFSRASVSAKVLHLHGADAWTKPRGRQAAPRHPPLPLKALYADRAGPRESPPRGRESRDPGPGASSGPRPRRVR